MNSPGVQSLRVLQIQGVNRVGTWHAENFEGHLRPVLLPKRLHWRSTQGAVSEDRPHRSPWRCAMCWEGHCSPNKGSIKTTIAFLWQNTQRLYLCLTAKHSPQNK